MEMKHQLIVIVNQNEIRQKVNIDIDVVPEGQFVNEKYK
jgi:hypothetical protein